MNSLTLTRRPPTRRCRPLVAGGAVMTLALAMSAHAAPAVPPAGAAAAPPRSAGMPACHGELATGTSLSVAAGKSSQINLATLHLPTPAWLRVVGDADVVKVDPMAAARPQPVFFLFGKKVGATNLMFQTEDGRCAVIDVSVGIDSAALQAKLAQLMPGEPNIRVGSAADTLVLTGSASDSLALDRALSLANAFVRKAGVAPGGSGDSVVNLMTVGAPQQVMLEVKVAEIAKTLVDQLGVNFSGILNRGDWAASLLTNFLSDSAGVLTVTKRNSGQLVLDAERKNALVKILAEPSIMAISGQEGSFLAGGKIFIPVAQSGSGAATVITLEEKEFGVGLRFTPTVLDGGRINLKVAPEVSELSREGIGISASGRGGNSVLPFITTRRVATTVQLVDGQSFAIAGLIKNNVTQNINAFPILGELPVLGALFRSSSFQTDKSELVFVITPRLVKPLAPNFTLPTDHFVEPSRGQFFLEGKMEGTAPAAAAPPAPAQPLATARKPAGFDTQ